MFQKFIKIIFIFIKRVPTFIRILVICTIITEFSYFKRSERVIMLYLKWNVISINSEFLVYFAYVDLHYLRYKELLFKVIKAPCEV